MDVSLLSQAPLFQGVPPKELESLLSCLGASVRRYRRGERVLRAGEAVTSLGLVLSGSVLIESAGFWGGSAVLDRAGPGQIFAETYACLPGEPLLVDVTAGEDAELLFLAAERILTPCPRACPRHAALTRSLLALSARKNLILSRTILHTAPKTVRERLLSYLSDQSLRAGSRSFTIPFDRQQLADYLSVDRSALSAEIGRLRREGVLTSRRSEFTLCDAENGHFSRS